MNNKIGVASDHAGFELKEHAKELLQEMGYEVKDFGTYNAESCDYPDFAHALAQGIEQGEVPMGIAVCGSGEGICITLNKHQSIRAALVWRADIARLSRQHNDANVLCLPGRFLEKSEADNIIKEFLTTSFEGGRHLIRVNKIPISK
ncbi:MAG: ribose 5-phosphate isomerase B [Alloprevotella sp.]|nr:ribose 5-phosphate isomerase B [Alloprevotella sp.]